MRTVETKLLTGHKVVGTYLTIVTYPYELKDARYTATWEIRVGTYEFAPNNTTFAFQPPQHGFTARTLDDYRWEFNATTGHTFMHKEEGGACCGHTFEHLLRA
jgi:hypothetical protein